ncbi:10679_t:CDS:2 [Funneliformis geosporum]|uniref:10080_t:CDS:1 n=1 Tax=Funneliformis geosporum TaxID=1117311 RepID=A0A9W4SSZ5_9GLOM|nr:10080_t:CDS:2 [Funneliformis geosporum]CAI2182487.1 10679_t:CDS:2 [Funneliformis geosporum]
MSKRKNYIFNNTFPDDFDSYKFENVNGIITKSSQASHALPDLQSLELTDSETETQPAINIGNKKTAIQVRSKIQSLITKKIVKKREKADPSDIESEVERTINQSKKMAIEIEQERLNFEKQKLEIKQNEKKLEREVMLKIEQEKLNGRKKRIIKLYFKI